MNKRQKEVEQAKLTAEEKEYKHLKAIYKKAASDVTENIRIHNNKIDILLKDYDNLSEEEKSVLQSQIYRRDFQMALKKQLDVFLENLGEDTYSSIDDYMKNCYRTAYTGSMYDIAGQGIPVISPIDEKRVVEAMKLDSKISKSLYTRLGEDVNLLKKRIANNVSRGIATSSTYGTIANNISYGTNVSFNRAMTIAVTEGHRVHMIAASDAQHKAKDEGADVLKQWDATMDKATRPHHRQLDGQIRELDEDFEVAGLKVKYPSAFGIASEDIRCRCVSLQRARWALDEDELETLKERAEYFKLDKTEDFEDFKRKYLKLPKDAGKIKVTEEDYDLISNTTKLKKAMKKDDYAEYMDILNNHQNESIKKLYSMYADKIEKVHFSAKKRSEYVPFSNELWYSYPQPRYIEGGKGKFSTLAHEYGHFFDAQAKFKGLHFKEVKKIADKTQYGTYILKERASFSDEFLQAARKDRKNLSEILNDELREELKSHYGSCGVQDAIDGLLGERILWGHGDRYYNRKYSHMKENKDHKGLQEAYLELGFDADKLSKVAGECRIYDSASEMWANMMSAEINGGEELKYVKKYLPNSYKEMLRILKGVERDE